MVSPRHGLLQQHPVGDVGMGYDYPMRVTMLQLASHRFLFGKVCMHSISILVLTPHQQIFSFGSVHPISAQDSRWMILVRGGVVSQQLAHEHSSVVCATSTAMIYWKSAGRDLTSILDIVTSTTDKVKKRYSLYWARTLYLEDKVTSFSLVVFGKHNNRAPTTNTSWRSIQTDIEILCSGF